MSAATARVDNIDMIDNIDLVDFSRPRHQCPFSTPMTGHAYEN